MHQLLKVPIILLPPTEALDVESIAIERGSLIKAFLINDLEGSMNENVIQIGSARLYSDYKKKMIQFLGDHKARVMASIFQMRKNETFTAQWASEILNTPIDETKSIFQLLEDLKFIESVDQSNFKIQKNFLNILPPEFENSELIKTHVLNGLQSLTELKENLNDNNKYISIYIQANEELYMEYIKKMRSITNQFLSMAAQSDKKNVYSINFTALEHVIKENTNENTN